MLDRRTLLAYLACRYEVHARRAFVLRIGQYSPALAALYARQGCACAAFLSAGNPRGRLATDARNARATRRLRRLLEGRGQRWIAGFGRDPAGVWPGEASVLVPGMALDAAIGLGRWFAQNAVLWVPADACPRLIVLR